MLFYVYKCTFMKTEPSTIFHTQDSTKVNSPPVVYISNETAWDHLGSPRITRNPQKSLGITRNHHELLDGIAILIAQYLTSPLTPLYMRCAFAKQLRHVLEFYFEKKENWQAPIICRRTCLPPKTFRRRLKPCFLRAELQYG